MIRRTDKRPACQSWRRRREIQTIARPGRAAGHVASERQRGAADSRGGSGGGSVPDDVVVDGFINSSRVVGKIARNREGIAIKVERARSGAKSDAGDTGSKSLVFFKPTELVKMVLLPVVGRATEDQFAASAPADQLKLGAPPPFHVLLAAKTFTSPTAMPRHRANMNRGSRRLKTDGGFEGVERVVAADFIWIPCFEFELISVLLIWPIKKNPLSRRAGAFLWRRFYLSPKLTST